MCDARRLLCSPGYTGAEGRATPARSFVEIQTKINKYDITTGDAQTSTKQITFGMNTLM